MHGRTGFVVDARAPAKIAAHLQELAYDTRLWEAMCAASRPSVEHLTYAAFASRVNALYARVLR